jgi:hypothetical protein
MGRPAGRRTAKGPVLHMHAGTAMRARSQLAVPEQPAHAPAGGSDPQVYVALALTTAVAAIGAYADVTMHVGGIITSVLAFAAMMYALATDAHTTPAWKRRTALATYAFCMVRRRRGVQGVERRHGSERG